jgi:hypothetical protein
MVLQTVKNLSGGLQRTVSRTYPIGRPLPIDSAGVSGNGNVLFFKMAANLQKGKNINHRGPRTNATIPTTHRLIN